MAIKKTIKMENGIVTEYHRIGLLSVDVNQRNTLLVYSYLSEDGKYKDVDTGLAPLPYYEAEYINAPYDGEMTIEKAYEYLKTLPKFEGAEDI